MITGNLFNIQRYCLHDGPGIRTVVFLKGCSLRCVWCHNPESFAPFPEISYSEDKCKFCKACECTNRKFTNNNIAIDRESCNLCGNCINICLSGANEVYGYETSDIDVINVVLRDIRYYSVSGGGMTLSGGEPSYQEEFSLSLIRLAKDLDIHTAIETSGFGNWDFYKEAHKSGVLFLYDIKMVDPKKHKKYTDKDNSTILHNLIQLFNESADIIIRLPMIPGINDSASDIKKVCEILKEYAGRYKYAELLPYHNYASGKRRNLGISELSISTSPDDEYQKNLVGQFLEFGCSVRVSS